jgi:hypothetical protein
LLRSAIRSKLQSVDSISKTIFRKWPAAGARLRAAVRHPQLERDLVPSLPAKAEDGHAQASNRARFKAYNTHSPATFLNARAPDIETLPSALFAAGRSRENEYGFAENVGGLTSGT